MPFLRRRAVSSRCTAPLTGVQVPPRNSQVTEEHMGGGVCSVLTLAQVAPAYTDLVGASVSGRLLQRVPRAGASTATGCHLSPRTLGHGSSRQSWARRLLVWWGWYPGARV